MTEVNKIKLARIGQELLGAHGENGVVMCSVKALNEIGQHIIDIISNELEEQEKKIKKGYKKERIIKNGTK